MLNPASPARESQYPDHTVDIYEYLAPEGNKAAVDKLDDIVPDVTIRNQQRRGYSDIAITP